MPSVARYNDSIKGTTSGEHSGHTKDSVHSPSEITGNISGSCSSTVFCNNRAVAVVGSTTTEKDSCCGSSSGRVSAGSGTVFVQGKKIARAGDSLTPHNGTAKITGGSPDVFAN